MNARERGFLLLTSHLGVPERRTLSPAQLQTLAERVQSRGAPIEDRELTEKDLTILGYGPEWAGRIVGLMQEEDLLDYYLEKGARAGCMPITRVSAGYPQRLRRRLGYGSPICLWVKGPAALLTEPAVALVGSRDLQGKNERFAAEVGRQAARQGYVLVSGNARGADRTAQESCLAAGGRVISVVADELWKHPMRENQLYISEDAFDAEFSAQRALSRNRCIHAWGAKTFVAQTRLGQGGTWDGTVKNLRFGWSPVYGFQDGTAGMQELEQLGAQLIGCLELANFDALPEAEPGLFGY